MEPIKRNDTGAAVEDVQTRLARIGHLPEDAITGTFDDATAAALADFLAASALPPSEDVTEKVWAALVDATYNLGDRTLYLRMPYFHGHDVLELQQALGALGFFYGTRDAIFGAHTEEALRRFQLNLGLPSDGIAGAYTYAALRNLAHSWVGKEATHGPVRHLGFARAADVLERNAVCLFGTDEFSRAVASRMSNVAQATNPASKICVWPRPSTWPAMRAGPACPCCFPARCGWKPVRSALPSTTPSRCWTRSVPRCRSRRRGGFLRKPINCTCQRPWR